MFPKKPSVRPLSRALRAFVLLVAVSLSACGSAGVDSGAVAGPAPGGGQSLYLWVTAWQDATVGFYPLSFNNPQMTIADGAGLSLTAKSSGFGYESAFVRFRLPHVPAGTVVEEASFQLFTSRDLSTVAAGVMRFPVHEVDAPWDPMTITPGNRPSRFSGLTSPDFELDLASRDWCRSGDISAIVARHLADPSTNHGFVVDLQYTGLLSALTFHSLGEDHSPSELGINGPGRDLTAAPRLLLRIRLPRGTGVNDVVAPPLDNPADMLGHRAPVRPPMRMLVSTAARWPADWHAQ